jgi:uncharacterized membrane protein YhaH (DUF805 family)
MSGSVGATMVNLFFSMRGRIGRMPHILSILALILVQILFELLMEQLSGESTAEAVTFEWQAVGHCIVFLLVAWMGWCLSVKRAHDLGKSAWWVAGWSFLPLLSIAGVALFAGLAMLAVSNPGEVLKDYPAVRYLFVAAVVAVVVLNLLSLWNLVIKLIFFQGERIDNNFGPPPGPWAPVFDGAADPLQPFNAPLNPSAPRIPNAVARTAGATALHAARSVAPQGSAKPTGFGRRGVGTA